MPPPVQIQHIYNRQNIVTHSRHQSKAKTNPKAAAASPKLAGLAFNAAFDEETEDGRTALTLMLLAALSWLGV